MNPESHNSPGREATLISVLVRSTGRVELAKALQSIAAQDYPHKEIVIADALNSGRIDTGPADGVPVRVVNGGHHLPRSAAANLLLREARGQWVLFLDDDDWLGDGHLRRLAAALAADPASVAAYAGVSCLEFSDDPAGEAREIRVYDEPFDASRLLVENYIPIHAALVNLEALESKAAVAFDENLEVFEDWDFWLQCARLGPFVHVPGISAYYRIHSTGLGVRMDESKAVEALDKLLDRWAMRWTTEQRRALVALGRNSYQLRPHLAKLDGEIAGHLSRLTVLGAERDSLVLAVDALHAEVARQATENARKAEEIERLAQTYAADVASIRKAYETSSSWRVTAPLRASARGLRRVLGHARKGAATAHSRGSHLLLTAGLRAYKSPVLGALIGLVPFRLKRRLHQMLMASSVPAAGTNLPDVAEGGVGARVSIVIPVYNHAAYLHRCIQSALDQDWLDLEVIVVDDASPDPAVRSILESLEAHPRLTLLRNERNLGISETQNVALMHATGNLIAFLDCDDFLAPHAISTCMAAWKHDTVYLHTGRINIDAQDREVNRIHFQSLPRADYFAENLEAMYATHLKVIRRDAFAKVGIFDPRFDSAQDYEMLMRIAFHYPSSAFVHVPEFLYFHRLHEQQATERQAARQAELTRLIQREARLRMDIREGRYARKLSFIMLSYGKHSQTLKAIEGLEATVKVPHEIILYDNGSAAETVDFIRSRIDGQFESVRVFYGDRNLGPAQGRRKALDYAQGDWIIVFDNDEWPEPGWLEELLLRAESAPDVGAVCCRVAFPDRTLQFSGGMVRERDDGTIDLALHDRGAPVDDLHSCRRREVDWCPIGATLFTVDIRPFLHQGYPNVFEDAGVSFALKKRGLRLLNSPGSLVWHDHVAYMPKVEMQEQYLRDRYDPRGMLTSVASFYAENGLLIHDEYIWRENGLNGLTHDEILRRLARQGPALPEAQSAQC